MLCLMAPVVAQRRLVGRDGHVLAYGLNFNPNRPTPDMPVALQEILRAYQTQPRYAQRTPGRAVQPLLRSVRHQEEPFNRSCPYYTDGQGRTSTERCIVGCVATCIEQVLTYYRWPEALQDTLYGWGTEHYQTEDILPGTPIDWDNILYDYRSGYTDAQAQAVSDLSFYCGMAAHMSWGLSSSGANLYRAAEPLWRVFGYRTVLFLSRAMYATPKWDSLLRNELENGRPICYTGHNMALSGHAFNIDGVDEQGYYHLNWGYGGDYDGYYDLDYLNPFEYMGDETEMGRHEGFFSNQTALFLHPDACEIDISDSLTWEDAFSGVRVENVVFRRQPDTKGYTVADFTMTNTTHDSLNFTFEVMTYLPTDTAVFMQADYVGLSAVNLAPGQTATWPVYCHFTEMGERILAISADDETLPFQMPVNIEKGTSSQLHFGQVEYRLLKSAEMLTGEFGIDVTNSAEAGYSGDLVTYCLYPEGETADERHWSVLSLPAGQTERLVTQFRGLEAGRTYRFVLRCPWDIQAELSFTVNPEEFVDGVTVPATRQQAMDAKIFDFVGRQVKVPRRGFMIRNGKKYWIK